MPHEICQRAQLGSLGASASLNAKLNLLAVGANSGVAGPLGGPVLVGRGIEEEKGRDVNIPGSVDAGEEGRGRLQLEVLIPLVLAFGHPAHDEANRSQGYCENGGQKEKSEPPNNVGVVHSPNSWHGGNGGLKNSIR